MASRKSAAALGESAELDVDTLTRMRRATREVWPSVMFMAPEVVRSLAQRAIRDRERFRIVYLGHDQVIPTDMDSEWARVAATTAPLIEAMRDDLGLRGTYDGAD